MELEDRVISWLAGQSEPAYLVGGCMRDQVLGRSIHDLDVSVDGDGLLLARRLADHFGADYFPLDRERLTGRAILRREHGERLYVDIARYRGEDLTADLAGRDFTINALAVDVRSPDVVIDLHRGLVDLEAGLVRAVSDEAIRNDPVRALRAVRHAAQLDFALAQETEDLIRRDGAALADVAGERICDELSKLLACAWSAPFLYKLEQLGLLEVILSELAPLRGLEQPPPHQYRALEHTLEAVRALELLLAAIGCISEGQDALRERVAGLGLYLGGLQDYAEPLNRHLAGAVSGDRPRVVTLKMAVLLHDVGKPAARSEEGGRIRFLGHEQIGSKMARGALERLRFSGAEARLAECIVRNHMRPLALANEGSVSSRAVYRFFRDTQDAGLDVVLHALADHLATHAFETHGSGWRKLVDLATRMLEYRLQRVNGPAKEPPLVNGRDLLRAFDLEPGPQIGVLLEAVREAQAVGEVGTRDEAMALVRSLLEV